MKKVTLAANGTYTIKPSTAALTHIALVTGTITYSFRTPVPADAPTLTEDLRTDSISSADKPIYIKAGTAGATFQFRKE